MNSPQIPPNDQILKTLRQSSYMRLLEYSAGRVGSTFTESEALSALAIDTQTFANYKGTIYADDGNGNFGMTADALPKYINFLELQQAREQAAAAHKQSADARRMALWAMSVSAILALAQIAYQAFGSTRIDERQVLALASASAASTPLREALESAKLADVQRLQVAFESGNRELTNAIVEVRAAIERGQKSKNTILAK